MNTNTHRRHPRISKGVVLAAAAASVAALVATSTPANAAPEAFVAVAVGLVNDNPPVQTVGGLAIAPDQNQAYQAALTDCVNKGGHQCVVEAVKENGCAAAASNDFGDFQGGSDITLRRAEENAVNKVQNAQGRRIVVSGCSNGAVPPPPPPPQPPAPPAPPKLGPTVSWKPIVGGLQAHITDRSGFTSQCTYTTDNYDRSFALPANGSYDLKIVPAVPQLRNWNVTIACDNGTTTQATTYF